MILLIIQTKKRGKFVIFLTNFSMFEIISLSSQKLLQLTFIIIILNYCHIFNERLSKEFLFMDFCSESPVEQDVWTRTRQAFVEGDVELFKQLTANESSTSCTQYMRDIMLFGELASHLINEKKEEMVKILLDLGADVNKIFYYDPFGKNWSIFSFACLETSVNIVKMMIDDYGADINNKDENGLTPVCYAFQSGEKDKIEFFVERGIDAAEINRFHLLHCYVVSKIRTEEMLKRLLRLGADVNETDESDCTVLAQLLMRAEEVTSEIVQICKLLLEHGANPNLGHVGALSAAAKFGNQELVELLLDHGAYINGIAGDTTPIASAASFGRVKIVELLLDRGAEQDGNALHKAICGSSEDSTKVLKLLLNRGFNVDCVIDSATPIRVAVMLRKYDIVKLLLDYGAQVDQVRREDEWCPLRYAAENCDSKIAKLLIDYGADINVEQNGTTALTRAISARWQIITTKIIVRQLVLMKSQNLFVSEKNLNALKSTNELATYYKQCTDELELLKTQEFND